MTLEELNGSLWSNPAFVAIVVGVTLYALRHWLAELASRIIQILGEWLKLAVVALIVLGLAWHFLVPLWVEYKWYVIGAVTVVAVIAFVRALVF